MDTRVLKAKDHKGVYRDVLVDGDYDGEMFADICWRVHANGYVYSTGLGHGVHKSTYLARLAAGVNDKPAKEVVVTCKNGNTLDLRSSNLQVTTRQQVALARSQGRRRNKLGYRGVFYLRGQTKFYAACAKMSLGAYDTPEEAALAYDQVAYTIWGAQATLNFPEFAPKD
jgi:hypothetical protein